MSGSSAKVASAILREVPLGQVHSFVTHMTSESGGTGCGGGCGSGCNRPIDQFAHAIDSADLKSAVADKAGLLKEIQSQASAHVTSLGR